MQPAVEEQGERDAPPRWRQVLVEAGGWFHGIVGWPIFAAWTVLVGAVIVVDLVRRDPVRRGALLGLQWLWGHALWWTQPFWVRRVVGREHIGRGPYVIVSNHRSVIDIPCLMGLGLPLTVVARSSLFTIPVLGRFVGWSGQVDTAEFDVAARRALAAGVSVLVFPEGTRSTERVGRFHQGAFRLAHETGVPLLPIATDGSQIILKKGRFMPTNWLAPIKVRVFPPVAPGDPRVTSRDLQHEIAQAVEELRS